jgi:hypothetical protein
MKKALIIVPLVALLTGLTGCAGMREVETRTTFAQPSWYKECAQSGTEGWLWWSKNMVYACGAGESVYSQAAEEQMYAIAMNNFAKRINSKVNSKTEISFVNEKKSTSTVISYNVSDTAIREHLQREMGHFTMGGKHYTFVRLKMPKTTFDQLLAEAKQQ